MTGLSYTFYICHAHARAARGGVRPASRPCGYGLASTMPVGVGTRPRGQERGLGAPRTAEAGSRTARRGLL
jgi:hypothetical protein